MKEKCIKYLDSYIAECEEIKELSKAKEEVTSPNIKLLMDAQKEEKARSLEAIRSLFLEELISLEKEALAAPIEEEVIEEKKEVAPEVEEVVEEIEPEVEEEPKMEEPQEEPKIEEVKQEEAPVKKVVKKAVKRSIYRIEE